MTFDPASYVFSQPSETTAIRASTVLPAHRENVELRTADGHRLVGELALPESGEVKATLITLHPLPTHGGFMDSHVYRKASYRLPALAGIAVLRFNTRGTGSPRGTSGGSFEEGIGERLDVEAAVKFAVDRGLPNRWLVGWSFGTELALMYGATEPVASEVEGAVLLSPPLHRATDAHLAGWAASGKPLKVLVPEYDDYLQPEAAAQRFSMIPQARVVGVDGAKHLWVGEKYAGRVLNEIVEEVLAGGSGGSAGTVTVLPQEWDGPVATAHA
jgi:alpha/beta superfamily hydrolase